MSETSPTKRDPEKENPDKEPSAAPSLQISITGADLPSSKEEQEEFLENFIGFLHQEIRYASPGFDGIFTGSTIKGDLVDEIVEDGCAELNL
jgi:hypothetical protein